MKKVIFGFIAIVMFSTVSFANTPTLDNDNKNENQLESIENEKIQEEQETVTICTASCSQTVNGITYSATAGNWFSSCERAQRRCEEKLKQFISW